MGKIISSLIFLALVAVSNAASAVAVKMQAHNQRSSAGVRSTLVWRDCGSANTGAAPCINFGNTLGNPVVVGGLVGSTATWNWDPVERILSATGLYWATSYISSNPSSNSVVSDRVMDLVIDQDPANPFALEVTGSAYNCFEGAFLKSVGAHGCATVNLGRNAVFDSALEYNVDTGSGPDPECAVRTLGGDDLVTGNMRGLKDLYPLTAPCNDTTGAFRLNTLVQDNLSTGGTLILSNGTCLGAPGAGTEPQIYSSCAGALWMTFVLLDAADDAVDNPLIPLPAPHYDPLPIPVMANDVGFADPVTVEVTSAPLHGTAVVASTNPAWLPGQSQPQANVRITYTYTGAVGAFETDSFEYTVTDADGFSVDSGTVTVNLSNNDAYTIGHTTTNTAVDLNIGANDVGLGITDPVTVAIVSGPTSIDNPTHPGSVTFLNSPGPATGVVARYTPDWLPYTPTYTVQFTYRITGANLVTDDAVVTVTVTNSVPNATDETLTIETTGEPPISGAGAKFTVLGISSGNLGDEGTVSIVSQGSRGTAEFDDVLNQFTYAVNADFFVGTDTVSYRITDSDGELSEGDLVVTIPDAQIDEDVYDDTSSQTLTHKILAGTPFEPYPLPQILDDDDDDAGEEIDIIPLTIVTNENTASSSWVIPIVLGNGNTSQHTTELVTDGTNGHCEVTGQFITYTPDAGYVGADQCRVKITDGDNDFDAIPGTADDPDSDEGWVYVTVNAGGGGGGGGGGELSGGGGAPDLWILSLLGVAAGLRRRRFARAAGLAAAFIAALIVNLALPQLAAAQALEEIVVTARKQGEEKLKEVPVAITAFDSAAIESAAINSLGDVAALTPGLSFFNAFGENLPVPVIRGVVPQDIFGKNAAAVYVDNVYVAGRSGLNFSQLDVERIEVVKGPQSALYGRNAFSGAINYVTKLPSDVFEAKSDIEAGNDGKQRVMAQLSGPLLGDSLTGRLSALYDYWDGSYDNTLAPDTHIGGYRYRSVQGRLRWVPTDSVTVDGGLYYSNDEIDEAPVAGLPVNCEDQVEQKDSNRDREPDPRLQNWCGPIPDLEQVPGSVMPDPNATVNDPWVTIPGSVTSDGMPKIGEAQGENREVTRGNFNVQWDAGFGTFSFLSGYTYTEHSSASDFQRNAGETTPLLYCYSGTTSGAPPQCNTIQGPDQFRLVPMGFLNLNLGDTIEEFSQEIRFTSPADQRLRYTVGGYYFSETEEGYRGLLMATTPFPEPYNVPGTEINIPGPVVTGTTLDIGGYIFGATLTPDGGADPLNRPNDRIETDSWSLFSSIDFDLTEQLTLDAQVRFTEEEQTGYTYQYKRCALDDVASIPSHQTNYFPYNSPPVEICGDDVYDLRPEGAAPGTYLGPCLGNRSPLTGVLLNDGSCTPGSVSGSLTERFWTGRLGLKYQVTTDWMTYASVAWGEKPGGLQFVTANVVNPDGSLVPESIVNPFDAEKIVSYELGIKGYAADRRIGLDLSLYYLDWTDIILRQLSQTSPASGLPYQNPVGFNVNSGDSEIWGWEMTSDLRITENLTGRLTAAWTDSQLQNARMDTFALFPSFYTDDPSCTPEAIQAIPDPTPADTSDNVNEAQDTKAVECQLLSGDVSGNTQMRQPEWTASASLSYKHQLTGDWDWFTRADGNYTGKVFIGNDNQGWLRPRTTVNVRLGVQSPRYSLEFWVRNLFEEDNAVAAFRDIYWSNNDDIQATQGASHSNFDDFPPYRMSVSYPSLRTYGLVAKARFGGAER